MIDVHYPGPQGTFSERAARHFGRAIPARGFAAVVDAVRTAVFGVLPLENTLIGAVPQTLALLAERRAYVVARAVLPIVLDVVALPGTDIGNVKTIYSHPAALAQARLLLAARGWCGAESATTAGGACALGKNSAALCAPWVASELGLVTLLHDVADAPGNETQFVLLAPERRATAYTLYCEGNARGRVIGTTGECVFVEGAPGQNVSNVGGYEAKRVLASS